MELRPIIKYETSAERAARLRVSVRTLALWVKAGKYEAPVRLGGSVRWPVRAGEVAPS